MTRTQPSHVEVREKPRKGKGTEEAADEMEAAEASHLFAHLFEYSNCGGPVGGV